MKKTSKLFLIGIICLGASHLSGCAYLDRSDRLRDFSLANGTKVGINITDATKRLAIIYPNGRTCSELSPPAVLEVDKAFKAGLKAGETSVGAAEANVDASKKTNVVKLTTSTEKIECIRISMFHACTLSAAEKLTPEQEISLYGKAITTCYGSQQAGGE